MASPVPTPDRRPFLTAVTVMNAAATPTLCPFFGRCEGVLFIDSATGSRIFHPNAERTAETLCALLLEEAPERLICGFIGDAERDKLRAAGIEIRMGSCSCSVDELTTCFCDLPEA